MKKQVSAVLILLFSLLIPLTASAASVRAYVADFTVSAGATELKGTLQRLFSSRLSGDGIVTVESAAEADVIVTGSYTTIGKMFSLDAFAKTPQGKQVAAAYEQGESLDALIPAVGKISAKLKGEIVSALSKGAAAAPVREMQPPAGDIIRREQTPGWTSRRIPGVYSALASWGGKEFVIAGENGIKLFRRDVALQQLAEAPIPDNVRLLGVDAVGPDAAGKILIFVTILDREFPASRIYSVEGDKLKQVAQELPYMFRTVAPYGGPKKLYAQQMGRSEDYYGDVYEASYSDGKVQLSNPIKMPRFGNIFNFNMFRDQSGKSYITAFSESGYLIVYSDSGEELWRSSDKFGGSETYYQRRDVENERASGSPFRTRFIDQRITVTDKGEVLVPQNAGFLVLGNIRSYSRYSIVSFTWNGSSLEELWRSKQSQNYLADYAYAPETKELILLEVTQKTMFGGNGGSAVRVMRAE